MNPFRGALVLFFCVVVATGRAEQPPTNADAAPPRSRQLMDFGWRFAFGHPSDPAADFDYGIGFFSDAAKAGYADGPAAAHFDDSAWRLLNLPHDWAVEAPFAADGSSSHGYKAVGRNHPEASIGWYRKSFSVSNSDLGRRIAVEFDGVFRDSVVWINGFRLAREPSGYASFRYDLTDYLNYGGENVIVVRVDATREEGWFYEGAGIYRHVWLTTTAPVHVAPSGIFVSSEIAQDSAMVTARTTVANESGKSATLEIEQSIVDEGGRTLAKGKVESAEISPGAKVEFPSALTVEHPRLWSLQNPTLHTLVTELRSGGRVIDRCETRFGFRTVRFDANEGFFLNGERVELKGTNNHQDFAGVGVAVPDALWDFRIRRLKAMGSNAYRCAHNPPAPELLEACDRLGLLVIDENRLMGSSPEQLGGLEQMIVRDRNHPSVILWSLGNEEWAIEGNVKGARIAVSMQAFAQRLDPTRRMTVANSGGWGGISSVIDVVGYNYIKQSPTDEQHAKYPNQPGVGTEESTTRQTRGIYADDPEHGHIAPRMEASSGGNMEKGWQHYAARRYLAGLFFWTGFDYRGEPNPYDWPQVASQSGILDTCGFPKDGYYYLQAWWNDAPSLHLHPYWNWAGKEGQPIEVWCYSNCEEVELLLNGHSLGKKSMPVNGHLSWSVPYEAGALEGRGFRQGTLVKTSRVETTGQPATIRLVPERSSLRADRADATVVDVGILDAAGRLVPAADNQIKFQIEGPGSIIGTGNGDPASHEAERGVESVRLATATDWRGKIVGAEVQQPSNPADSPPLAKLGNWLAKLPQPGQIYDLSAMFELEPADLRDGLKLFLPSLGTKTTVWVNGHKIESEFDTSLRGVAVALNPSVVVAGRNQVQSLVTPFTDHKNHIPELSRLGAVQILSAAPPVRRHAFNGLAQLIVQAGNTPGPIRVTAEADGLPAATVELTAEAAAPVPSVP